MGNNGLSRVNSRHLHRANGADNQIAVGNPAVSTCTMSRRRFIGTAAAGAAALVCGSSIWTQGRVEAATFGSPDPKPILGGIRLPHPPVFLHVSVPDRGVELATITDFEGLVGVSHVLGVGTRTHPRTGVKTRLLFSADLRFMQGTFIGMDGQRDSGTYGFV